MLRAGADAENVQMEDVLCDFCHRPWTERTPFVEGHRGRVICARCLAVGYVEVIHDRAGTAGAPYTCALCREDEADRDALARAGEPGWASPLDAEVVICARCLRQAAATLAKDPDCDWTAPGSSAGAQDPP